MSLIAKLRRIALQHQGLLHKDSFGRGKPGTLRTIEQLGYVQIDTISVVERAHHHVLRSRVSNYSPAMLDQLVQERKVFEYWAHAAAWLPMADYRFALPRMAEMNGDRSWFPQQNSKLTDYILQRIATEGPLKARDFEDQRPGKSGWWDWKPAKQALEQLFMQGELMVSGRNGFQKIYDLPERVLPEGLDTRQPDVQEYAQHLIAITLRAQGFATCKSITYLRKGKALRDAVFQQLEQKVSDGKLTRVEYRDQQLYINPDLLDARAPRCVSEVTVLSPFDNCLIQRARTQYLFGFDFQIECYVPARDRKYGYFCLPLLYRDRLVGRIDCKAHRKQGVLEVKSMHLESRVDDEFYSAFDRALQKFSDFNGCDVIEFDESRTVQH